METKQITLRSQTVQCQNCGEYYSVTYKYCPFCEFGKPEERKSGHKGVAGGLLGGFLNSSEGKKPSGEKPKKKPAESKKRREESARKPKAAQPEEQARPAAESAAPPAPAPAAEPKKRSAGKSRTRPAGEEQSRKKAMGGYADWYASPEYEATRKRSAGPRKKTSEMTEAEKAAYQAEREARAAERKRERERMTRAAAISEMYNAAPALVPDDARPTQPAAPAEGIVEAPVPQPVPAPRPAEGEEAKAEPETVRQPVQPEQEEIDPAALENIPLFIPEDLPEVAPVAPGGIAAPVSQEQETAEIVVPPEQAAQPAPVVPQEQPVEAAAPESDLDALLREIREMLGEAPVSGEAEAAPTPEVIAPQETEGAAEVLPESGDQSALLTEESAAQPETAVPSVPLVQEEPLTAGELLAAPQPEELTIDQIMNEVKQGLLDMPAEATPIMAPPPQSYEQPAQEYAEGQPVYGEQPAQYAEGQPVYAEQPVQEYAEGEPVYAEQPVQEYIEGQPVYAEQPVQEYAEGQPVSAEQHLADEYAEAEQEENPFRQTEQETDPALAQALAAFEPEPEILAASAGRSRAKKPAKQPAQKKKAKKRNSGERGRLPILPIISLIVIVLAIFIVVHSVVPAFRTGVLSGGGTAQGEVVEDTAESFTLDQTELNFVEPGAKVTLIPVFEPEGSAAVLNWTCDNWGVAYLDPDGTVTSMAPGDAVITATMANGQSAQCQVHCAWDDTAVSATAEVGAEVARSGEPALVTNDITLSEEGASKTLELVGAESAKWASSNTSVATVDQNGVVTAVSKGSASVTAEVGEKTLTCAVRCVW